MLGSLGPMVAFDVQQVAVPANMASWPDTYDEAGAFKFRKAVCPGRTDHRPNISQCCCFVLDVLDVLDVGARPCLQSAWTVEGA